MDVCLCRYILKSKKKKKKKKKGFNKLNILFIILFKSINMLIKTDSIYNKK